MLSLLRNFAAVTGRLQEHGDRTISLGFKKDGQTVIQQPYRSRINPAASELFSTFPNLVLLHDSFHMSGNNSTNNFSSAKRSIYNHTAQHKFLFINGNTHLVIRDVQVSLMYYILEIEKFYFQFNENTEIFFGLIKINFIFLLHFQAIYKKAFK